VSGEGPTYLRFTPVQRLQHLALIVSFTVLALTGLPQKYAWAGVGERLIGLMGGIEAVRIVHRIAAIALMAATIVHVVDVAYLLFVERVRLPMLPRVDDLRQAWQAVRYTLGQARERPRMGRYTFEEKVEYWSLVWGTLLMIATGFMLWNPIATTRFLPGQFIPASQVVHGGEAVLAVLAILIWHGYGVHLRHFNRSMFTGVMTEAEMREEHPAELQEILSGRVPPPPDPPLRRRRLRRFLPVASVAILALFAGLWYFVTFEQTAIPTVPRPVPIERAAQDHGR
jgi:cytochrome b subunit of formate dehydrogenase